MLTISVQTNTVTPQSDNDSDCKYTIVFLIVNGSRAESKDKWSGMCDGDLSLPRRKAVSACEWICEWLCRQRCREFIAFYHFTFYFFALQKRKRCNCTAFHLLT